MMNELFREPIEHDRLQDAIYMLHGTYTPQPPKEPANIVTK
jgi:hypothetical protein